jgi:Spy/CpxP family protein refolding chaperone
MKTSLLSVLIVGATLVVLPARSLMADAPATSTPAAPSTTPAAPSDSEAQGQRMERFRQAMAQLDLSDAQKAQIKHIRSSVADKQERRQQIMAVLTPDQKAKLVAMIQERRASAAQ